MENGWVVVFDLDDTIYMHKNKNINIKALNILKKAVNNKGKTVSAIFLLTNNSDTEFIENITTYLNKLIGNTVFDFILSAEDKFKNIREQDGPTLNYSKKRVKDIEYMCNQIGISKDNLVKRILFFDDQPHVLRDEIENYALVKSENSVDWEKGNKINSLPSLSGGRRRNGLTKYIRRIRASKKTRNRKRVRA
jgi:hypothetical protein